MSGGDSTRRRRLGRAAAGGAGRVDGERAASSTPAPLGRHVLRSGRLVAGAVVVGAPRPSAASGASGFVPLRAPASRRLARKRAPAAAATRGHRCRCSRSSRIWACSGPSSRNGSEMRAPSGWSMSCFTAPAEFSVIEPPSGNVRGCVIGPLRHRRHRTAEHAARVLVADRAADARSPGPSRCSRRWSRAVVHPAAAFAHRAADVAERAGVLADAPLSGVPHLRGGGQGGEEEREQDGASGAWGHYACRSAAPTLPRAMRGAAGSAAASDLARTSSTACAPRPVAYDSCRC